MEKRAVSARKPSSVATTKIEDLVSELKEKARLLSAMHRNRPQNEAEKEKKPKKRTRSTRI